MYLMSAERAALTLVMAFSSSIGMFNERLGDHFWSLQRSVFDMTMLAKNQA